jgi:DNA-binding NtrC family response regulator
MLRLGWCNLSRRMKDHGSTRARVLHWFVRGGLAKTADGRSFPIDVDPMVVGRDSGVNIGIDDPEVSEIHCELRAMDQGILVRDLGSTNGTFIGPTRIHEAVITTATDITLGGTRLTIEPSTKQRVDVGFEDHFGPLVGSSPKMRRVFSILEKVSGTPLSVLLLGESGTGKELAAKAIHTHSPRRDKPFVILDCGSIPPTLAEGLLFGHEKSSAAGGAERRKGALSEAHEGTLFLDELGELPLDLQPKLLRAVTERQLKRVGGSSYEPLDVRILAATRRDLGAEMNSGRFRSDLYFRLAQVRVELPPLRERLADLPLLVEDICARVDRKEQAPAVLAWIEQRMASHDWPGNVRELVNVASVAATLADTPGAIDDVLTLARGAGDDESGPTTAFGEAKRTAIAAFERDYFVGLAKRAKGNVSEMARQSGMERHHVRAYLRKYGVDRGANG